MKTLDELLALVQKAQEERKQITEEKKELKEEAKSEGSPVRKFINSFPIKPGLVKVPTYVIYYTYCVLYKSTHKRIGKTQFFVEFKKMFKQSRHGTQRFYLLDAENLPMNREGLLEAKYFDERNGNGKPKKKKETPVKGLPPQS